MSDEQPKQQEEIRVVNPLAINGASQQQRGGQVAVAIAREVAEAQAALMVAKTNRRNEIQAMDRILNECSRVSLAEKAEYSYARGGQEITGPSIRAAEVFARNWGNMACGTTEISRSVGPDGVGVSECVSYAWDLETNFRDEKRFQVRHWRDTRQGGYKVTDERDIYEMVANQGARRKRACILAIIPGDVIEAAIEQCHVTLKSSANFNPERLKAMVTKFAEEYGVTQTMIEKRLQRRLESITPPQFASLGRIYTSLSDGMSSPKDWFDFEAVEGEDGAPPATAASKMDAIAAGKRGKKKTEAAAAEPEKTPPKTEPKPEPQKTADTGPPTQGQITAGIINAKTAAEVDELVDLARSLDLSEAQRKSIDQTAQSKKKTFTGAPLFGDE